MGNKVLKITVHGLSDENYIDVAHGIAKTVKSVAPNSEISILGATPQTFKGSSNKEIEGK